MKRSQNSFLLLTTLGVYIGLLVAGGAAPQVLAHSATSRTFEIMDEIEVKDDLDNKPDLEELALFFDSSAVLDLEPDSQSRVFAGTNWQYSDVSRSVDLLELDASPNSHFDDRANLQSGSLAKHILERTRSSSQTFDILVLTRLPRAGLDALLAKDAK